ncbi:MAG: multiheme c-type cytochrome, partial [Pollutimonas bauzanensis]
GLASLPVLLLVALAASSAPAPAASSAVSGAGGVVQFLDKHWQRPLAPQGAAPPRFTPLEAALDPASCGSCHAQQFQDWSSARHAKAMGPGVMGQLMNMEARARDEQQGCIRCHAPLAEQADSLVAALSRPDAHKGAALHEQGLACAACHVRGHRRYGPARRDGSVPKPDDQLPHGGWRASAAYADSRFCASCHQFEADGYALNGKLLENTYEEWKASPYAREGKHCQSCHMPGRRHLWRGIHDADMVRNGVTISVVAPSIESGAVRAALTVRNTGTGHHFPTYVTPKVVVEIIQEDPAGRAIAGTRREYLIARQVPLDLSREIADTRLAAGAQATLAYAVQRQKGAANLVYRVKVEPDAFYTGLYRSLIADGAGKGEALIRQALTDSLASHYTLFEERRALGAAAR